MRPPVRQASDIILFLFKSPFPIMSAKVFISYSHADETLRDRLAVHLKPMEREGLIESWYDRRLLPGDRLDQGISEQLEAADVILFLVSPDALGSEYCYEIEMKRALERHREGSAKAISIILDHCDWKPTPLSEFVVLPLDGRPVMKFPNHNEAFLQITRELRKLLAAFPTTSQPSPHQQRDMAVPVMIDAPRSGNLSIKKEFRDRDRSKFLNESFIYIRNFIEGSLTELAARHTEIDTEFRELDADRFTAKIYRDGKEASSCSILRSEGGMAGKWGIAYQTGTAASRNTMNGALSVNDDGQALGFENGMMDYMGGFGGNPRERGLLSQQGAADELWKRLVQPLQ